MARTVAEDGTLIIITKKGWSSSKTQTLQKTQTSRPSDINKNFSATVEQPKRQETSLSFFYNLERMLLDKLYTNRKEMNRRNFL